MKIGNLRIGPDRRPVFVAELSGNHNGDLGRALALMDAAAEAGAHAVKIQTYTADSMTIDVDLPEFRLPDDSLWKGQTLHDLYEVAQTPWEWHAAIFERAAQLGVECFSTPFDAESVDFLEQFDPPAYKIASFESTDHALLRKVAATGRPVLVSTGMSTLAEIAETVDVLRTANCADLMLLKCTSAYPATAEDANLRTIPHMREAFGCEVGLSDHTLGIAVPVASVALGASLIEKHVTLRRADGGVDSAFSLEPTEVRHLVEQIGFAQQALGRVQYDPSASEQKSMRFRRSLYVVEDVAAGEQFNAENVRAIRPGFGLAPKHLQVVFGRTAASDVKRGTAMSWDLLA